MAEIIFSDFYRTILLCILSVCIAFLTRNATKGKRVLALLGYEAIMLMPFLWILVVGMVFTDFNDKSMIDIVLWELKWILYFTLITIFQFLAYWVLWKKCKVYKVLTLLVSVIFELIGVPFLYFKQNSPAFVFVMLATVVLVIVMMMVYLSISRKYEEK